MGNNHVYILTNYNRTTLYIGVTSNLIQRLGEHEDGESSFSGKYKCKYLIYYEHFSLITEAIAREKQLKRWSRTKKNTLIERQNPTWAFMNDQFQF